MSITTDLNTIKAGQIRFEDILKIRMLLQSAVGKVADVNVKIQEAVDAGGFNFIPMDVKVAMNDCWTLLKAVDTGVAANADIGEALDWRP